MKFIENGKTYNTETATEIGHASSSYPSDFQYCSESLYVTKKGAYFIAGKGGAMSKYATSSGNNSWGYGEGHSVISKSEALRWCEQNEIEAEVIEQFFEVEEG